MSALGQKRTYAPIGDVRFTPNSDHESGHRQTPMSALPSKADMCDAKGNVRYGPIADINHFSERRDMPWLSGSHTRWDITNIIPGRWQVIRKTQRRIVLEKLSWPQINIDVFHVSFAVGIGKNSKTLHTLIVSPST
jgi:hypothetical protein